MRSPWNDPMVQEALKERPATDVYLMQCLACGTWSYWNQGSHFTCSAEGCDGSIAGDELDDVIQEDGFVTLDEWSDAQAFNEEEQLP